MPYFRNSWVLLVAFILYFPRTLFAVESIHIVSDLQNCEPKAALSAKMERQKWRVIPYQTDQLSGHMLAAASFIQAPPVTLKLDLKGWHRISIGIWNPEFSYDGQPLVKIKLSDAPAFCQIHASTTSDTQSTTYLSELPVGEADLTGQDMVIAKSNGMQPRSAFVAYFRFTPMTNGEIDAMQQDRQRNTRNLVACIDGTSYFHFSEYNRREHFLEQVELYRHSDVKKFFGRPLMVTLPATLPGFPGHSFSAKQPAPDFKKVYPATAISAVSHKCQKHWPSLANKI